MRWRDERALKVLSFASRGNPGPRNDASDATAPASADPDSAPIRMCRPTV